LGFGGNPHNATENDQRVITPTLLSPFDEVLSKHFSPPPFLVDKSDLPPLLIFFTSLLISSASCLLRFMDTNGVSYLYIRSLLLEDDIILLSLLLHPIFQSVAFAIIRKLLWKGVYFSNGLLSSSVKLLVYPPTTSATTLTRPSNDISFVILGLRLCPRSMHSSLLACLNAILDGSIFSPSYVFPSSNPFHNVLHSVTGLFCSSCSSGTSLSHNLLWLPHSPPVYKSGVRLHSLLSRYLQCAFVCTGGFDSLLYILGNDTASLGVERATYDYSIRYVIRCLCCFECIFLNNPILKAHFEDTTLAKELGNVLVKSGFLIYYFF
jgi:hypothetical protein